MKKDITVCIGTIGGPTFKKCYRNVCKVASKDGRIKDIVVIKNRFPTNSWLNEMRVAAKTTWTLQVDEDMYLHDNCIDILIELAGRKERAGIKILNASGMLFDLFLKTNIGSLKLWSTSAFRHGKFKNVQGSDRKFAEDLSKLSFLNVATKDVLGEHDSAPNIEIAYFKYKEYVEKIINFQSKPSAKNFINHLKCIHMKRRDNISKYAYVGGLDGLMGYMDGSPLKTKDRRKNILTKDIIARANRVRV